MSKIDFSENIPKIPDKIIAYVSGCSTETVKKVKSDKRKDRFNISRNKEEIENFLLSLKLKEGNKLW